MTLHRIDRDRDGSSISPYYRCSECKGLIEAVDDPTKPYLITVYSKCPLCGK